MEIWTLHVGHVVTVVVLQAYTFGVMDFCFRYTTTIAVKISNLCNFKSADRMKWKQRNRTLSYCASLDYQQQNSVAFWLSFGLDTFKLKVRRITSDLIRSVTSTIYYINHAART